VCQGVDVRRAAGSRHTDKGNSTSLLCLVQRPLVTRCQTPRRASSGRPQCWRPAVSTGLQYSDVDRCNRQFSNLFSDGAQNPALRYPGTTPHSLPSIDTLAPSLRASIMTTRKESASPARRAIARRLTDLSTLQAPPQQAQNGFKLRERAYPPARAPRRPSAAGQARPRGSGACPRRHL